jgi:hypothetical protein
MSDSHSDALVDDEEEEDLECARSLLSAGRKRRHTIHNYFTYNKISKKRSVKLGIVELNYLARIQPI